MKNKMLIIAICIALLVTILTIILIMNNKTKWTSDYDFLYSKAIDYIVNERKEKSYDSNKQDYQVFTDYKGFGISIKEKNNEKYAYMYILEECYYVKHEKIRSSEGSCIAYKFTFNENNEVINYEVPKDGGEYIKSIKRIFPKEIENEILNYTFDHTKLVNNVKEHYSYLASTEIVHTDNDEQPIIISGIYGGYTSKAEANTVKGKYIDGYGDIYEYTIPCDKNKELLINIDEISKEDVLKYMGNKISTISKEDINTIKNSLQDIEDKYENKGIYAEDLPSSFLKIKYVKKDDLTVVDYSKGELTDLIKTTNEINTSEAGKKIISILNKYNFIYNYE